jgi:hypothetical protein
MHRKQYSAGQMQSATGFLLRSTPEELGAALDAIRSDPDTAGTDPERAALAIMAAGCPGLFDMLEQLKAKKERGRLRKWRRNGRRDQIRGTP